MGQESGGAAEKERNENSFIQKKYSQLTSTYTGKVFFCCIARGGMGTEGLSPALHALKSLATFKQQCQTLWTQFSVTFSVEFSLQTTRGVNFTLSTAGNNLCRHICPWLRISARLGFPWHTSLKSLSSNTFNTTTSTCRNCPDTCCRTGRDLYIKRIYCKAKRLSKRK